MLGDGRLRVGIAIICCVLISACDGWPPKERTLRNEFENRRATLESLAEKLNDSPYVGVMLLPDGAIGDVAVGDRVESRSVGDDPEWSQMFRKTRVYSVQADDYGTSFTIAYDVFDDATSGFVAYRHAAGADDEIARCRSEFESARCGRCLVALDTDWWIDYGWFPQEVAPDAYDAYLDDEIDHGEYLEKQDAALNACISDFETLVEATKAKD